MLFLGHPLPSSNTMDKIIHLFRHDFKHDSQVAMCAKHLEVLRRDLGDNWWKFKDRKASKSKAAKNTESPHNAWTNEQVDLARYLIRHASESTDFFKTVDFITKDTLSHIKQSQAMWPGRSVFHLKQWGLFTHEHMVPGLAVLELITDPDIFSNEDALEQVLADLSFRALITGTKRSQKDKTTPKEVNALDRSWESTTAKPTDIKKWNGPKLMADIPYKYYGLMRYEAAGLLDKLIPVTPRAKELIADYSRYRKK